MMCVTEVPWTKEEADAFDEALREQRQIDPEMWK